MAKGRAALWGGAVVAVLCVAAMPLRAEPDEGCGACKPKVAAWPWKANGYALGESVEAAHETAKRQARQSACEKAFGFLKGRELSCGPGCTAGELTEDCEPTKAPCLKGNAEDEPGMWKSICLKSKRDADACGKEAREAEPFYAMCDVSVKAEKVLPCRDPDCEAD